MPIGQLGDLGRDTATHKSQVSRPWHRHIPYLKPLQRLYETDLSIHYMPTVNHARTLPGQCTRTSTKRAKCQGGRPNVQEPRNVYRLIPADPIYNFVQILLTPCTARPPAWYCLLGHCIVWSNHPWVGYTHVQLEERDDSDATLIGNGKRFNP